MFETLDKLMLAGLGALSMSRERAEKIFEEYVHRGEAEKANRSGFVKDLMDTAEKSRKDLEKFVADEVHKAIEKINVVTREDLQRVEEKLDQLLNRRS